MSSARRVPVVRSAALAGADAGPPQLPAPAAVAVAPYLSTEQLAAVTPWTVEAINTMRKRGVFKAGVHYFQPSGKGGQVIFKWAAVVKLIEGQVEPSPPAVVDRRAKRSAPRVLNVEQAEENLQRLLG